MTVCVHAPHSTQQKGGANDLSTPNNPLTLFCRCSAGQAVCCAAARHAGSHHGGDGGQAGTQARGQAGLQEAAGRRWVHEHRPGNIDCVDLADVGEISLAGMWRKFPLGNACFGRRNWLELAYVSVIQSLSIMALWSEVVSNQYSL